VIGSPVALRRGGLLVRQLRQAGFSARVIHAAATKAIFSDTV
jgi:hypothetical protein